MKSSVDYYTYWNKKRATEKVLHREKKCLVLLRKYMKKGCRLIDIGCGNGKFLQEIKKRFPEVEGCGIEGSDAEVKEARKRGLNVIKEDLEKGLKKRKRRADIVYLGEVLEHVYDPDGTLDEVNQQLKTGGLLLLATPNLCAWFNRLLMLIGMQPLFLEPSTRSKLMGAGILGKLKKESQPVGHVRVFTYEAVKDLLKQSGFQIIKRKGAVFDEGLPRMILPFDWIFSLLPSLAAHHIILARKIREITI